MWLQLPGTLRMQEFLLTQGETSTQIRLVMVNAGPVNPERAMDTTKVMVLHNPLYTIRRVDVLI